MKIEILIWKTKEGVRAPFIEADELAEETLEDVAGAYLFDGEIGMIVDGVYGIASFDMDYAFLGFRECSKEEAEEYALA